MWIFDYTQRINVYHENIYDEIDSLLSKRFTICGEGRNRRVYTSKFVVFKIPLNDKGILDNIAEAESYKNKSLPYPQARCRIITILGLSVLLMERLEIPFLSLYDKSLPAWIDLLEDGRQAGYTRNGKLVVYDYAPEITGLE